MVTMNRALEAIEDANKARLEGVFHNIDFNSQANLPHTCRAGHEALGHQPIRPR